MAFDKALAREVFDINIYAESRLVLARAGRGGGRGIAVVELFLFVRVADTAHDKELAVGLFHHCGGQLRKALCGAGVHYDARLFVFRKIGLIFIIQRMLGIHEHQALVKSHARVGAQSVDIYFVKLGRNLRDRYLSGVQPEIFPCDEAQVRSYRKDREQCRHDRED